MRAAHGDSLWIRIAPGVTRAMLVVPVAAGLVGVLLPAFGYFPPLGGLSFSLEPWRVLWSTPGVMRGVLLSLWVGSAATLLSLGIVAAMLAQFHNSPVLWFIRRVLSPLLSVPHAAIAIGLAFVIAPSGLLFRLLAQFVPGMERPPDLLIVHDPLGMTLIAALVLKEVPFLFLMSLAALPQINPHAHLQAAGMMGYPPQVAWLKVVLPRLYPQIRLPVIAVLAYSLSVVDAALVLGPTTPPPLAVSIVKWMNDPEVTRRFVAAAGAVLMFGLTLGGIGLWIAGERLVIRWGRTWIEEGAREPGARAVSVAAHVSGVLILSLVVLSSLTIVLWAFAGQWPFPQALPERLTADTFRENSWLIAAPLANALGIGFLAVVAALILTVSLLERDVRRGRGADRLTGHLIYVPLIMPQIAFLPGLQILLIALNLDGNFFSVVAAHLIFVFPYVYLSVSQPWHHFDDRYRQAALSMGAPPLKVLLRVRLPMLLAAVLTAAAVGFAVSIGQYLPTLLLGSGRIATITTEAVALASGGDRRLTALLALLQGLLPFIAFLLAIFVPLAWFHNRRGLRTA
jgi:putative thiamine transport system permease protein